MNWLFCHEMPFQSPTSVMEHLYNSWFFTDLERLVFYCLTFGVFFYGFGLIDGSLTVASTAIDIMLDQGCHL